MKKRLDIQSLLEDCEKEDLVRFLRSRFAQNRSLVDDFVVHFASSFELDEDEFYLITNRIRRMIPTKLSGLTHRKIRPVNILINDLLEQTRDSHSEKNYRQAYIIVSHVIALLDDYTDQIPDKYGLTKLQDKSYQLLDGIYRDCPAPALKSVMHMFLKSIIQQGKAIPFHETANPYNLILNWEKDISTGTTTWLNQSLEKKIREYPEHRRLWLSQQVQLMIKLDQKEELVSFIGTHGDERIIYEAVMQYLPDQWLNSSLQEALRKQYLVQQNRAIKNTIYQILQSHGRNASWMNELAIQEYFDSGNMAILENLLQTNGFDESTLTGLLENQSSDLKDDQYFRLYTAYRYLNRPDLLKVHLLEEDDIFDILPFLNEIYPDYKVEVQDKLRDLIENYLASHFGRPAVQYVNNILDELNRLGHYGLQDFLIRKIRHSFGHRKHFQKLMKELVQ